MKKSRTLRRAVLSMLTISALCFSGFFTACSDSDDDSDNDTQNQEKEADTKSDPASEQPAKDDESEKTELDYTLTDTSLTYKDSANLKNITLPAFDVTDADLFTISLDATFATDQSDWTAQLLKTSDNYIITIPNLDPWNNTAEGSTIVGKNAFPTADGAYLANSLIYTSAFTGAKVAITVSLNKKDKTIVYTLNGKAWVVYSAAVWDGGIEEFITVFANALKAGTLSFNPNSLEYSSLVITKGQATNAEVKEILLEKATVTTDIAGLTGVISDIKGYAVYSDGSSSTITQATEGLSLAYTNSQNEAVTQPDSEGTYTVKVTYGGVDTTFSLVIGSPNKVSGTGTVDDPYVLTTTFAETIQGKEGAIDCNKYQSTTTHDTAATVSWKNPLYGLDASTLTSGITISMDVYSANVEGVNGYDALLTFFKANDPWNCLSVMEGGTVYINSGAIGGYFDNIESIKKGEWVKVSLVFGTDGTITYYQGATAIATAVGNLTEWGAGTQGYSKVLSYFTETADNIAVGVGFSTEFLLAGYVDAGSALANIKIYSSALTADQVAAIN